MGVELFFFRPNFNVYIHVVNTEKKETNFVARIIWKFYTGGEKMRSARGLQGENEWQRK